MKKPENNSRCLTWFMALLLSVSAAGCGGGGGRDTILGTGGATVILVPPPGAVVPGGACLVAASATVPTVIASDPTSGNQVASTSTNGVAGSGKLITATFSLPMNPATINASTFAVAPTGGAALVPASVSYNAVTSVATLTTSSALLPNTSYTALIQGATSATGAPINCSFSWTFKTAAVAAAGLPPVSLGRASLYAIASAAGVVNTGATTINGNVVVNPTATCNAVGVPGGVGTAGFGICGGSPPVLVGTVVTPTSPDNTTAVGVMADLRTAYDSIMKANLPGATVLGCGTIGSTGDAGALIGCSGNATLPPGVYISSTNSSIGIDGVLTLDGQGDQNARFIFQMPSSTLTMAGGGSALAPRSRIALINGAKASNVFWQVGSSATIGTFSQFQGNILADTSITMQTNATSCGRLLAGAVTTSGAFVFAANSVSVPGHVSAPAGCL